MEFRSQSFFHCILLEVSEATLFFQSLEDDQRLTPFCMNFLSSTTISPKIVTFKMTLEAQVSVLGIETARSENNYKQCKISQLRID